MSEAFRLSPADVTNIDSLGLHVDLLAFLESKNSIGVGIKEPLSAQSKPLDGDMKLQTLVQGFQDLSVANFTYAENGIDFDPTAAVNRQACFARKMSQFGWLYSPSLGAILQRAAMRYRNFFLLVAELPGPVVPDLDVDLVWHTHQLSPARYASFSRAVAQGVLRQPQ